MSVYTSDSDSVGCDPLVVHAGTVGRPQEVIYNKYIENFQCSVFRLSLKLLKNYVQLHKLSESDLN